MTRSTAEIASPFAATPPLPRATLPQLLAYRAARPPDRVALVASSRGKREVELTYPRLDEMAQRVGSALVDLRLEPGDRVPAEIGPRAAP